MESKQQNKTTPEPAPESKPESKPEPKLQLRRFVGLRRLAWTTAVVALLLTLLPEGLRLGAQYSAETLGVDRIDVADIDLNLFQGTASITGLNILYKDQETLSLGSLGVDLSMRALLQKQVLIESIDLNEVELSIFSEEMSRWVVGLPIPVSNVDKDEVSEEEVEEEVEEAAQTASNQEEGWRVGLSSAALTQVHVDLTYNGQQHRVELNELLAENFFMWKPTAPSSLSLSAVVNGAPLSVGGNLSPFDHTQSVNLTLDVDRLNLDLLNLFLPPTLTSLKSSLSLNSDLEVTLKPTGEILVHQKGDIELALDQLSAEAIDLVVKKIRWSGATDIQLNPVAEAETESAEPTGNLTINGKLLLADIDADIKPLQLDTRLKSLSWEGGLQMALESIESSLKSQGDLQLSELSVDDRAYPVSVFSLNELTLQPIKLDSLSTITMDTVGLNRLEVLDPSLSLQRFQVDSLTLSNFNQLTMDQVMFEQLNSEVTLNKDKKIDLIEAWIADLNQRVASMTPPAQPEVQATSIEEQAIEPEDPMLADAKSASGELGEPEKLEESEKLEEREEDFHFHIKKIVMQGKNTLSLLDETLEQPKRHPVVINTLELGDINSKRPSEQTPIVLDMITHEHGQIDLKGALTLLQPTEKMSGELEAHISGVELPEFNLYLEPLLGYRINSGQLNTSYKSKISEGTVDSNVDLKVQRIDLEPVDKAVIKKLSKHISMPVETALKVITDSKDTLALDIPIKGDLSAPDIHIGKVVTDAVSQAVQNTALTYFKYAVQPFGAILLVSEKVGDLRLQARFEDVQFVPGKTEMIAKQKGYLEKVSTMLEEKPDLTLLVCVVVTEQDFQARTPPLVLPEGEKYQWDDLSKQLAKDRVGFIKRELVDRYGVKRNRIQSCKAQLKSGQPRAVIGI